MNIKIKPIASVEAFTENGESLGVFSVESTWEGFRKFVRADGSNMIATPNMGHLQTMIHKLMNAESEDVHLVMASPGLVMEIRSKERDLLTPTAQSNG